MKPILLLGGYGVAGRKTALELRKRFPDVPLAIAGRHLEQAEAWAKELGNAQAYQADVLGGDPDLGLPGGEFSAMALFMMDETASALDYAARHAIPYICVSGGAFEVGQQLAIGFQSASKTAVIIAGHWFCGGMLLPVLDLASHFSKVDRVQVGIVIDRAASKSGPATMADFERILGSCQTMPTRIDGRYRWIKAEEGTRTYTGVAGRQLEGTPAVAMDAVCIGAVTGAPNVEVLESFVLSHSSEQNGPPGDEIVMLIEGSGRDGSPLKMRREMIANRETSPLTAVTISLLLAKAAGLESAPLEKGLYLPELVLDPAESVALMARAGVRFSEIERL